MKEPANRAPTLPAAVVALASSLLLSSCASAPRTGAPGPTVSQAAKPAPTLYCPRTDRPPVIDGRLEEVAWRLAPVRYTMRVGKLAPLNPCAARLLWDAQALYVAYDCVDQDILSTLTKRDSHIWEEGDCVEMFLLLPGENAPKVELELNPKRAFLDILHRRDKSAKERFGWTWRGARWAVSVRGTLNDAKADRGWSAELKLPWSGLRGLGVSAPPEGAKGMKVLFMVVNRVRARGGWLGREQSLWPSLTKLRLDRHREYANLAFVGPRTPDMPLEGFMRVVRGHARRGDALFPDFRGLAIPWEYDTGLSDAALVWETQPVPMKTPDKIAFVFVGQALAQGGSKNPERHGFDIFINDRRLLRFAPYSQDSAVWTGGGARLEFHHRAGRHWPSGLYRLTVPSSYVKRGAPARLEARKSGTEPRTRFIVKAWTDAVLYERHAPVAAVHRPPKEKTGPKRTKR